MGTADCANDANRIASAQFHCAQQLEAPTSFHVPFRSSNWNFFKHKYTRMARNTLETGELRVGDNACLSAEFICNVIQFVPITPLPHAPQGRSNS